MAAAAWHESPEFFINKALPPRTKLIGEITAKIFYF